MKSILDYYERFIVGDILEEILDNLQPDTGLTYQYTIGGKVVLMTSNQRKALINIIERKEQCKTT